MRIEIPLAVSGVDLLGKTFTDAARTMIINQHGAKILCGRKLASQIEISVRSLLTQKDAEARVIGCIREDLQGAQYGIEFLDVDTNIWEIEFPPIQSGDSPVGRILLECIACKRREITKLEELEAEVIEVSGSLYRHCKRCADLTLWKEVWLKANEDLPVPDDAPGRKPEPPKRTLNDRRYPRLELQMEALIRDLEGGEEMVKTVDISRGGFRFMSHKYYAVDCSVEVALPLSLGGANVFSRAKVKYALESPAQDGKAYGVAYTSLEDAGVDRPR